MKNILTFCILFIFSFSFCASAQVPPTQPPSIPTTSPIPLGPKMVVWAIQQAHSGSLSVSGDGLLDSPRYDIDLRGTSTLEGLLRRFDIEGIFLQYKNPDAYTISIGEVRDAEGQLLLKAEHWWKAQKVTSDDGRRVSYTAPDWSKNLWFNLQDIKVPFDGEQATAHITNGATISLDVFDGKVTLPAMLSWSQGTLEVTKGGFKTFFDIGTGAQVTNTHVWVQTKGLGVDSIQQLQSSNMSVGVVAYNYGPDYIPVFETVPEAKGWFTIYITAWDQRTNVSAVWVNDGKVWKRITQFQKGDPMYIRVPVEPKKSIYFYLELDPSAEKG